MIGDKKKLRDGRKILFTKANPTTTFNAILKFAHQNQFNIQNVSFARTNSKYIDFLTHNGLEVDLRCSNHTKGSFDVDSLEDGIDFDGDTLSIDLALADISAKNILQLIKECEIMLLRGIDTPTSNICPLMCQLKGIQQNDNDNQKDYSNIYTTATKEAVKQYPFAEITATSKDGAIYHFGETIDVDVLNTQHIQNYIHSGLFTQKQIDREIQDLQSNYIQGYTFMLPNGRQIKQDRENVIAQRKNFISNKLNESVSKIVEMAIKEIKMRLL